MCGEKEEGKWDERVRGGEPDFSSSWFIATKDEIVVSCSPITCTT